MSKGTLGQVVKRAISDAAFRRQLQSDPEGALKGFDLTSEERAALRSGDASKLSTFGVDQRMSKAFTFGEGAGAASRAAFGGEMSDSSAARAAFIGEASGAEGARISDAGGARAGITSEGTGVRTALGDQHDGGRAAIGGDAASGARAVNTDAAGRLAQVNAAFEGADSATSGRNALGDQHDIGRAAIGDTGTASREGAAYITANEAGNDVVAGGSLGPEQHAVVSSDGRDPYLSARDSGTGEFVRDIGTGEPLVTAAAAPLGPEQHAVVSSDGRDPYLSARDSGTGEFVRDIGTGEAIGASGAQSSLDVSGQTRDAGVIDSGSAGRQTDAFMTADEMGNDVSASGSSHPSLSADQRLAGETLEADITPTDTAADPWVENPEHQG